MDKFFSNLGGGGDKKKKASNNNKGKDDAKSSWQGGSGDMDAMKKKSGGVSASRLVGGGGGGGKSNTSGKSNNNIFANAGAGINDALGKIDLFNKPNKAANSRGGGQSLGGSKPGKVISVSLDEPGSLGMEVRNIEQSLFAVFVAYNNFIK